MPSTSRKTYSHGFILTEQEFRRIHDITKTQMGKALIDKPYNVEFELIYKNGVIYSHSDFESIFSEENIDSSAVQHISMRCFDNFDSKDEPTTEIFIEFRNPSQWYVHNSIRYRVLGNERDWVFITSSQLEERIKRTRRIALPKFFNRGLEGVLGYIFISTLMAIMTFLVFFMFEQKFYASPVPPDSRIYHERARAKALDELQKDWKEGKIKDAVEAQIKALKIANSYDGEVKIDPMQQKELDEYTSKRNRMESKRIKYHISIAFVLILIPMSLPLMMYFRPPYVFYWGENIKVIDKRGNAGKFLFIGIILAIVLSVVSNYIYDTLK